MSNPNETPSMFGELQHEIPMNPGFAMKPTTPLIPTVVKHLTGIDLIAAERERQITEEGYTLAHDRGHGDDDALARAAAVYAMPTDVRYLPTLWPNDWEYKPTPDDRIRELVKAGALIAAEIDRLGTGDRG